MTTLCFLKRDDLPCGFEFKDHTGYAEEGEDILCAAISSAVYLTVNTITDIIGLDADIEEDDGYMRMVIGESDDKAECLLRGLRLHMEGLREQYPKFIKITDKEGAE